jgi:hypothetical protein
MAGTISRSALGSAKNYYLQPYRPPSPVTEIALLFFYPYMHQGLLGKVAGALSFPLQSKVEKKKAWAIRHPPSLLHG